ncbi:NAD-dependent succinate-semialdehyde dehydrogenase [Mycolicibacterium sp. 120266]|uniref:NAD-dependent succinate-semialdehyde dehydrogenase n=1 Tax=Mycolicibacterium sp. 120266 TaxID=3090601 RepID=UPI00299E0850|nr:NAD-dependent succinate-semialdehyde dehydrogenase [Mycolicibacterium sp. 120266]MDX1875466.1 NAD-dependent succinate-semialdehyde dehydrogenase [Mycolicibacterium sp. 120266]
MSDTIYAVTNPWTGEVISRQPTDTDAAIEAAVSAAAGQGRAWGASTPVQQRADLLRQIAEVHAERKEALAAIIVEEMGKPIEQARGEVDFCVDIYQYFADVAADAMADEPLKLRGGNGNAVLRRSPLGTILGIMPWNFPYYQVARFAGANLVIGNPMLLKHAPQCPQSAAAVAELFRDAGVPTGVFGNLYASNEQIARLIADPRVQGVSLTGSERAGAAVAEVAGRHLKKVLLELGGSDPFIVMSTDDLDQVVASAVDARMDNGGQSCNAAKRFIVIDDLYDAFVERLVEALKQYVPGDPSSASTTLGPLSSVAAADRLEDQLRRAKDQGADVVLAGERIGNGFTPTVLAGIRPDADAYREEFFGPVASVYRVGTESEALEVANDTPFGLGSFVFTTDPEQAIRMADQIDAGMVYVNGVFAEGAELPFGGVKRSGIGRELGRVGLEEFVNKKLIRVVTD